jgi:hypothetical protein
LILQNTSAAAVPVTLLKTTTQAAVLIAAGKLAAGLSASVTVLTEGVLRAMFMTKLKFTAAFLAAACALGIGGGTLTYNSWAREQDQEKKGQEKKDADATKAKAEVKQANPNANEANLFFLMLVVKTISTPRMNQFRKTLAQVIDFQGLNDPKATLGEMLESISDRYDLTFDINEPAFNADGLADVLNTPIAEKPIGKLHKVHLSTLLKKLLSHVPNPSGATYIIRRDVVEITTGMGAEIAMNRERGRTQLPLIQAAFEKTPLDKALKELSDATGFNIIIDVRAKEKANSAVTADFVNVPVDTAVRILADMAELKPVLIDNVFYITSRDNADKMLKDLEAGEGKREEFRPEPAPKQYHAGQ